MDTSAKPSSRRRLDLTERDLVIAFKGGDSHAYAVIYRQFRPVAESICLRILGNQEDAQEAAQETMLRVFQGLPRFNGRYLLRAWVARIATNVCLDMIRKRGRRVDEVDTPDAEELEAHDHVVARQFSEDPSEVVERIDEGRRVRIKLNELPAHHRDALLMREYDGLSHEEIASKLGMTAPQVKALLHRAKKGFRRAWEIETGRASVWVWPAFLAVPARWFRRLAAPAKDAVAEAAAPVIQLGSQPAVAHATAAVGERVTAAAGAILVAGTIGIGAGVLPNHNRPAPKPKAPAVAVAEDPASVPIAPPEDVLSSFTPSPSPSGTVESGPAAIAPRPRPMQDPSTEPSPSPSPSDGPSAAPEPSPTASPAPEPAPAYSMGFRMRASSSRSCECQADSRLVGVRTTRGTPGGTMTFGQAAEGAIRDAEGDAALQVRVEYSGNVNEGSGTLTVDFTVTIGDDIWTYRANLDMLRRKLMANDVWEYQFTGRYQFVAGDTGNEPLPRAGTLTSSISFWRDGTIFKTDFDLG